MALLATGANSLVASTASLAVPAFRGQPGAQFAGWESFTTPVGQNSPDLAGSTANSKLTQTTAGAFLTGSGNLYVGPDPAVGNYSVSYSGGGPVGPVVFQSRTLGNELAYAGLRLDYSGGSLAAVRTELERTAFGGPPGTPGSGFAVASQWSWELGGLNVSEFTISFKAAAADVSFDSATLDVRAVPEPQTWALAAIGAVAIAFAGWRRR